MGPAARALVARGVVVLALLVAVGTAVFAAAYRDRILPGVRVAGIELAGLTLPDARARLETLGPSTITLTDGAYRVTYDDTDIGVTLDLGRAAADAYAVGRSGDLRTRVADWLRAPFGDHVIEPSRGVSDRARLELTLAALRRSVERAVVEGEVRIDADGVHVRTPQTGRILDEARLASLILGAPAPSATIALPITSVAPRLDAAAIGDARAAAVAAYAPLTLSAGSERMELPAARVAELVRIDEVDDETGPHLVASADASAVAALASAAAGALDGDVREATLVPGEERLRVEAGRDGVRVDVAAASSEIAAAIFGGERAVALPAAIRHPALTTEAARAFADSVVLVGAFTTYFPVNPARATNIGLAAAAFDGQVVAPGESFSFWDRIGEVSPRTGYVYAGTIIGGVSSYAIGGGLCQVSTTFFNAVIRGGYRVDERHEHSYCIERYPLGLDAAVLAGAADMRWTNDTAVPVQIRAQGTATSVTFWLYAAPTGRSVEISDPRQWNIRYPSPDQPADPQHAPGYVVPGRDTLVTRVVYVDGVAVSRDEWYSHYAPVWGGPG